MTSSILQRIGGGGKACFFRRSVFTRCLSLCVVLLVAVSSSVSYANDNDSLTEALSAVCKVDLNGDGHDAAVEAMKVINAASIDQVPEILKGMDGANRLSANWLRSAVLSIVGRGGELPGDEIKAYFKDTTHSQMGRLLAYDLLTEGDDDLAQNIIPTLIDDPSMPLRQKAIAMYIEKAESEEDPIAKNGQLAFALEKARNVKQVQQIAKLLSAQGVNVDLQKQLGFLSQWEIVGAFDNRDQKGFDVKFGPEKDFAQISSDAKYDDTMSEPVGMDGKPVEPISPGAWLSRTTVDDSGVVDLNALIGEVKGATAYATTTFNAVEAAEVELRIGTPNAHKVWVNGELVIENEIYHNSNSIDKFSGIANLVEGKNRIVVKACQNEQKESWAQDWQFQLRICDETGKAIKPAKPAPSGR